MKVEGNMEIVVPEVGIVTFVVVKTMTHEAILGCDQLHRHSWSFGTKTSMMEWGAAQLPVLLTVVDNEAASVDAGCLNDILQRHRAVFGEPGKLLVADLPPVCIETEPRKLVTQCPYQTIPAKRELIEQDLDKMLQLGVI